MKRHILRKMILALILTLSLAAAMLPAASAAGSIKATVAPGGAKVYAVSATPRLLGTLPAGTMVTVEAVKGAAALISANGHQGICPVSSLRKVETQATASSGGSDVVTTQATRIYSRASLSSAYVNVPKGMKMQLLAVNGACAMVSRNGKIGYTVLAHLGNPGSSASTTPSTPVSGTDYTGSNEQIVIQFLMRELGYNRAAACGVAANIKYESGFKPTSVGDGGTSYGIAQWHAGRKTRLISWCSANGLDYTTLSAQLYYLKYELTTSYTMVHNYLLSVSDSADGAYYAGYYFCYHFESPVNRASQSNTRGNYARNTVYARYV